MSKANYLFTTISYGQKYHQLAYDLAKNLALLDKQLLIFTDDPNFFKDLDNVILQNHAPRDSIEGKFSGYDKIRIADKVFAISDCMWYIDADWTLKKEPENINYLDEVIIRPGLTCAMGPSRRMHSSGYPKTCIEWIRERYGVSRTRHYGEACFTLKNGKRVAEFIRIMKELGELHDEIEHSRGEEVTTRFISKGSGISYGFAQQAARMQWNSNKSMRKAFYSNFEHLLVTTHAYKHIKECPSGLKRLMIDSVQGQPK